MFKNIALSLIAFALTITMASPSFGAFGGGPVFERNIGIFNDGTSTRPSITFSRETDLGFYRSGTNAVSFVGGTLTATMALVGDICVDDANGSCLMDEAASATNPTLVTNRADSDTGFGGTGDDNISVVLGGTRYFSWNTVATNVNAGNFIIAAGTYVQDGGNFTFNDAGGNYDFRVESADNDNMIDVDGELNHIGFGSSASSVHFAYFLPDAETLASTAAWRTVTIADAGITTYSSGTHESIFGLRVEIPDITISSSGVVTNAASVSIAGAPTEATNNYALWVDAGAVQFDGTLDVSGDVNFDGGSFIFNEGGNDHDMKWESRDHGNILFMDADLNRIILFGPSVASAGSITFYQGGGTNEPRIIIADSSGETIRLATTAGETTVFNDQGTNIDFRVESDDNDHMFFVDGGNNNITMGAVTSADTRFDIKTQGLTRTVAAGTDAASLFFVGGTYTSAGSGTNVNFSGAMFQAPTITIGTAAVTNGATVRILSGTSNATNNYALWVDAGESRFDGTVIIGAGATTTADGVGLTVSSASSGGAAAHSNADELVIEGSGAAGITIKTPAANPGSIFFGDEASSTIGQIVYEHSNNRFYFISGGGEVRFGDSGGETVFNESSYDINFRVEGTTSDHLLFVDSGNDSVSIGVNNVTPVVSANRPFQIAADDDTSQQLLFDNTGSGYWINEFNTDKNGDGQVLYHFAVHGEDSGSSIHRYAEMYIYTVLDNAGAETGKFLFRPSVAGTVADVLSVTGAVGDVGINVGGIIRVTDAAGPAMLNVAAEATVPTLVPNRADPNTGIAWLSSDILNITVGGAEYVRVGSGMTRGPGAVLTWGLNNSAVSATQPTLHPNHGDLNTGIGQNAAEEVSLITAGAEVLRVDDDATSANTRMFIYDVDNGQLERVSVGAADSGGSGFKVLRIAN